MKIKINEVVKSKITRYDQATDPRNYPDEQTLQLLVQVAASGDMNKFQAAIDAMIDSAINNETSKLINFINKRHGIGLALK